VFGNQSTVSVSQVVPLDNDDQFGATQFEVILTTPQTGVGTYSYSIGPNILDEIRNPGQPVLGPTGAPATQTNNTAMRIPASGTGGTGTSADVTTSSIVVLPLLPGQVVDKVTVTLNLTHTFDGDLLITLFGPDGTQVVLSNQRGGGGENYTATIF